MYYLDAQIIKPKYKMLYLLNISQIVIILIFKILNFIFSEMSKIPFTEWCIIRLKKFFSNDFLDLNPWNTKIHFRISRYFYWVYWQSRIWINSMMNLLLRYSLMIYSCLQRFTLLDVSQKDTITFCDTNSRFFSPALALHASATRHKRPFFSTDRTLNHEGI